jgi:hypothetical protein
MIHKVYHNLEKGELECGMWKIPYDDFPVLTALTRHNKLTSDIENPDNRMMVIVSRLKKDKERLMDFDFLTDGINYYGVYNLDSPNNRSYFIEYTTQFPMKVKKELPREWRSLKRLAAEFLRLLASHEITCRVVIIQHRT